MAEITPTPRAGHWITVDGVTVSEAAPRAGTWLRIDASGPVGGGWRIGKIGLG